MKKHILIMTIAAATLSSCGYTTSGALLGGVIGSAIGGVSGGWRGSNIGTLIGTAGGAVVGAAIDAQAAKQERAAQAASESEKVRAYQMGREDERRMQERRERRERVEQRLEERDNDYRYGPSYGSSGSNRYGSSGSRYSRVGSVTTTGSGETRPQRGAYSSDNVRTVHIDQLTAAQNASQANNQNANQTAVQKVGDESNYDTYHVVPKRRDAVRSSSTATSSAQFDATNSGDDVITVSQ